MLSHAPRLRQANAPHSDHATIDLYEDVTEPSDLIPALRRALEAEDVIQRLAREARGPDGLAPRCR